MSLTPFSCSLDAVVVNAELDRRPSRPPEYAAEHEALMALARTMAEACGPQLLYFRARKGSPRPLHITS